ncbi:MAG: hypothetical protein WDN28_28650 [Chthoniobacter sp.]
MKARAASALRQEAEQIEIGAADVEGVGAEIRRVHAQQAQFLKDLLVEVVVRGWIAPHEIGARRDESDGHGDLLGEVADEDGGLAGLVALHPAIDGNAGDLIVRIVDGEAGDVARGAVGEFGGDGQLDFSGGLDDHAIRELHVEFGELGRLDAGIRRAVAQPAEENGVFRGVDGEPLAAFVGQGSGGLEQDEAVFRLEEIDAPPGLVAGECLPVEIGVLPAQGKLEAAFAGGIAVAPAGVAPGLGDDGHHFPAKEDIVRGWSRNRTGARRIRGLLLLVRAQGQGARRKREGREGQGVEESGKVQAWHGAGGQSADKRIRPCGEQ